MYYLYILVHSLNNQLYIGVSNNVERRLREHNKESNAGYTRRSTGEWKLVGTKQFETKLEAVREEKRLKKSKNKKYILWFIQLGR